MRERDRERGVRKTGGMEGKIVHQTEKIAGSHCGCLEDGHRDAAKTTDGATERERDAPGQARRSADTRRIVPCFTVDLIQAERSSACFPKKRNLTAQI